MTDGFGAPLAARFGSRSSGLSTEEIWDLADDVFVQGFLTERYEVYQFDESSQDDEPGSGADMDPEDDLAWEIPVVQQWAKGLAMTRDELDQVSHFVGIGSGFILEEIIEGNLLSSIGEPSHSPARDTRVASTRCLWCSAPVERHYEFNLDGPLSQPDIENFEDPIVWSDGVVMERDGEDPGIFFPNHYGDSVIACSMCGSIYLASTFEKEHPRFGRFPDVESWSIHRPTVLQGEIPQGSRREVTEAASLTLSSLDQTMRFLMETENFWEVWTALQQVMTWLSIHDRTAKLAGNKFEFERRSDFSERVETFVSWTSNILEGTLGSLAPFGQKHYEATRDPNFTVHNFEVQEVLPLANMKRVCGFTDFGWSTPRHPAVDEREGQNGWGEFDSWIALRGRALLLSMTSNARDWAIAIDTSGNLVFGTPSDRY
jgi:hypothetical protein